MNTVAWVLILVGMLTLRQVSRGRTLQIGEDLSDALLALVRGDTTDLTAVLARTGTGNAPTTAIGDPSVAKDATPAASRPKGLAAAVVARGEKAKGYRWAATGPDYYDCSGLVWRGLQDIGYTGTRFSTATIRSRDHFKVISSPAMQGPALTNAGPGDIVLWPPGSGGVTGHMGVMTAPNRFYSARSVRSGIGESAITGFRKTTPIFLRYTP
jgi:cell wall-associated NlpC family hydrolase